MHDASYGYFAAATPIQVLEREKHGCASLVHQGGISLPAKPILYAEVHANSNIVHNSPCEESDVQLSKLTW